MNATLLASGTGYTGGLATLDQEFNLDGLSVDGNLPEWLTGTLYRNGPAKFEVGSDRYRHWFDGLAMVHRFTIAGANVSYANRFLRTPAFEAARKSGRIARSEYGTRAKMGVFERVGSMFRDRPSHNANVNIVPFDEGRLVAMTETPVLVPFDAVTLETQDLIAYTGDVRGQTISAHPHHDAARRASLNLVVEFGRTSTYHIVSVPDGSAQRTLIGSIAVDEPSYMHSFASTERYAIVTEYPLVVRPLDILFSQKAFVDNYRWQPERGTRIHVMRKSDGVIVARYEAAAFFAFHHVNAFEEGDTIVLDISAYPDASVIDDLRMDRLLAGPRSSFAGATLRRYRLEPGRETCDFETIADDATELPRLNPRAFARPYRYAYGLTNDASDPASVGSALVKVNVAERTVGRWSESGTYPGEPVFIARPGATDEDDGAILSVVFDAATNSSFLLALEARTFLELARVRVPHHIPLGFHGTFLREAIIS
jgi:beta,beta-carotene 9',10'-dioxygenase